MKIVVCMKEVIDTASKIELLANAQGIQEANLKYVINPYDEFALEEALRLKDQDPGHEVVAVSLGAERVAESLRKALAMGADRAIHLTLDTELFAEGFCIAKLLQQILQTEKPDIILTGRQAVDSDNYQVGPMLAALMQLPQVTNVVEFSMQGEQLLATREVEGGTREIIQLQLPCLVAMTKGVHEPRYASLKGIMAAKKKELRVITSASLGVDIAALRSFKLLKLSLPPERGAVKMISGEPAVAAKELVRCLREEAKVI